MLALTAFSRAMARAGSSLRSVISTAVRRRIGTVVAPDAPVKAFLTADASERARRRTAELEGRGVSLDHDEVRAAIDQRDMVDSTRSAAPLRQADDAELIDTTGLTANAVADRIVARGWGLEGDTFHAMDRLRMRGEEVWFNLGLCLAHQDDFSGAADAFRNAVRLKPNFAAAYGRLGEALVTDYREDEAIEPLRTAVRLDPNDLAAAQLLRQIEQRVGARERR